MNRELVQNHLEIALNQILAVFLLVLGSALPNSVEGSYVALTLNGRNLPAELRLPATAGNTRLFQLDEGVLRLSNGGRFTLSFRYHHQLLARGARRAAAPVMSETESGTFRVHGDTVTLTPAKKSKTRVHAPIAAMIVGDEIRASYVLDNAGSPEVVRLTLRRDASYW